jgi:hypothetical protein
MLKRRNKEVAHLERPSGTPSTISSASPEHRSTTGIGSAQPCPQCAGKPRRSRHSPPGGGPGGQLRSCGPPGRAPGRRGGVGPRAALQRGGAARRGAAPWGRPAEGLWPRRAQTYPGRSPPSTRPRARWDRHLVQDEFTACGAPAGEAPDPYLHALARVDRCRFALATPSYVVCHRHGVAQT